MLTLDRKVCPLLLQSYKYVIGISRHEKQIMVYMAALYIQLFLKNCNNYYLWSSFYLLESASKTNKAVHTILREKLHFF